MHLNYDQQLEFKRQAVVQAFERIDPLLKSLIAPCEPSPSPLAYRNKIQLPVAAGKQGMQIGLYQRNSHDILQIDQCPVHCPLGEHVFQQAVAAVKDSQISPYDPKTHTGELRYILIRTAVNTKQVLVTFVTRSQEQNPILHSIASAIMQQCPEVKGIVQNTNSRKDNVVLSQHYSLIQGSPFIEEELCGLRFRISSASFFQINTAQAENLYAKALEFAELNDQMIALDAYCGIGTLSLLAAKHAKHVIGIECVSEAIVDAIENAKLNKISNASFFCSNAETFINTLQEVDIALLNPPRKGCEKSFLEKLAKLAPKRIVYISCDPVTLARDTALLRKCGFQIDKIQPYDMFPQTTHVECVAVLKGLSEGQ